MSSEDGELLLEDGPLAKRLRIALRQFKNTKLLDIRYWYQDKTSMEMRPTAKGISLTRSNYLGLRSVTTDHHDAIMEYLDVGFISSSDKGDAELATAHRLQQQAAVNKISLITKTLQPASKLYEIEYDGAHAKVSINTAHPLGVAMIKNEKNGSFENDRLASLIVALDLSMMKLRGNDLTSPDILLDQLEYDFARNVKNIELKRK